MSMNLSKRHSYELDKRKSVLKANYLYKLLKGDVVKNDVSETVDFLNIDFRFLHFAVLVLQINYCGKFINSEGTPDKLLAKFAVSNIAVEVANKEVVSYAVELDNDLVALVLNVPWDVSQEGCYKVNNIARTIKEFLQENFGVVLTIGIGRIYSGIVNISKSYKDAIISFDYKIVKGKGKIITYSDVKINNESYYYPLDIEQQLINNVKAGDFNNLKDLLNSIFKENFEKRQLPYKLIQCLYFDIMSTAIKVLNEINIEYRDVFGKSFDPITELLNCDNVIDMYNEIVKIFEGICCHINKKKKSHNQVLLDRIIEHVQKKYMKENFCVQSIAEDFGMNPSYISYFFKEQTGKNLNDYIAMVRIEMAKELLSQDMPLKEIAEKTGLGNDNRLIRLFKKEFGITPGKYRSSLQASDM